jgi:protein-L-isoaspartate(D-aspartate) O-methyltransferase
MVKTDPPQKETQVVGIEHIEDLAKVSVFNLNKSYANELNNNNIRIVCGDGRTGYTDCAPYDAIHVGAGTPKVPTALLEQLKIGGKLIIPVG